MAYNSLYVTRYMGAKYKLLDFLLPQIESELPPKSTFLDLMAGTHAVGYALKQRHPILANDVQNYSFEFGRALLSNHTSAEVQECFNSLYSQFEITESSKGWFSRTYADTYFSMVQCREIEEIRMRLEQIDNHSLKAILLVALANALSLCQSSPGHFAQYMPASHSRLQTLRSMSVFRAFQRRCLEIDIAPSEFSHQVFKQDVFEFLESDDIAGLAPEGSLAYLDPPYSTAQYSRYYHLLETVILMDEPSVSHKGLYRPDRHQSPFCSTKQVVKAFDRIALNARSRGWKLAVSYSSHGLVTVPELIQLLNRYYPRVELHEQRYSHSMQGRGVASDRTEIMIIASF